MTKLGVSKKNNNKLIVQSRTENLSKIRDFVSNKASETGMSNDEVENIMLAVDEACTNIIKHAYKSFPDGEIIIKVEHNSDKLLITIVDYGNSFDPLVVPDPDLPKYYKDGRVGGLGMYLMKSLMDDIKYKTVPGKYNQVLLSKRINVAQN
jgi:serine/threonine-protein kinase RsbW